MQIVDFMFFLIAIGKLNPGLKNQAELTIKPNTCMKHYYSFLVLSLFVFLSLVCPSPVMAECTNTLALDIESDRVIPSSCPTGAPSGLYWNHNYYGVGEDDYFWDWKGTRGELYYKITLNGATTCTFSISLANSENAWMNIYSAGTGSDQCVVGGETYHKSSYHGLNGHNRYGSFNTETVSSVSLSEGTYIISIYGENNTSMQSISITASDNVFCESSCTAPNHVDISGEWGRFGGETISLTATAYSSAGSGSPIADANITGYQWQKLLGSTWTNVTGANVTGATSANLQISNCDKNNSGKYRCVVSTGATCSTASATATDGSQGFQVRVYTLECYTGGSTDYNFTRVGVANRGTVEVTLSASTTYQFKIHGDDYFGNNGTINEDVTDWDFETGKNNVQVASGLGGTFTFTIDYSANGAVPDISVTYPRKTIYLAPNSDWKKDNAKFAIYYYRKEGETTYGTGWTDFLSPSVCDGAVYPATIPQWNGVQIIGVRFNSTKTSTGNFDDKWNQTSDLTLTSNDLVTITGWDNSQTYNSSYDAPEYKIFFVKNGADGGSDMSDVEDIECDGSVTLDANTWTKTGYDFDGWNDGSSDYADEATISNIISDITLTAQWTVQYYDLTWNLGGGTTTSTGTGIASGVSSNTTSSQAYGTSLTSPTVSKTGYNFSAWSPAVASTMPAANTTYTATWTVKTTTITIDANTTYNGSTTPGTVTATWGSELPEFTAASGESGWRLKGYYTAATDGTKIINADGSLVANTDYATDDETPVWKYETSTLTLYPQYDLIICQSSRTYQVEDILIAAGSVDCKDAQADGANTLVVNSTTNTSSSHYNDYMNNESGPYGGGYVMNTAASKTIYMEVDIPSAGSYDIALWYGKNNGDDKVEWLNIYTRTSTSYTSLTYGDNTYYKLADDGYRVSSTASSSYHISTTPYEKTISSLPAGKIVIGIWSQNANAVYDQIRITHHDGSDVFCKHTITVNNTSGASSDAIADKSMALSGETVTVTASAANSGYHFTGWTATSGTVTFADASSLSTTFVMPDDNVTLTANYALDELTISSLPWAGSQDLTGQTVVSAEAISSCFDSEITFTFMGDGTVNYYDNTDRKTSLGRITSGTAIILDGNLRAHGIYIRCTSDAATLTAVSKTTIGSIYEIWSGDVAVDDWSQQVVLGPEHFQTAEEGDVLRVNTSGEGGEAQGALQYIYTNGDSHTYKGLDNSTSGGLYYWNLSDEQKSQHYFEITINETHLANLQRHGVIVKGRNYTIQSVELRASCSNQTMRTSAPDVTTYGDDGTINIMTDKLELPGDGFDLGNWEDKVELHKNCFTSVTVGSIINFYMKVQDGATLSFRCNVDSIHAESYQDNPPRCPSYGDISFDRTIHNLYGDEPQLIGRIEGYKVLYLLVDADMLRRLQETGMILCGKGTLIKVVEGVPETVIVNSEDRKKVPTVVNNLEIHQGGEVTNDEDIEVLGKITYIRPAKDDGKGGKLGNKLDQWYTFALPFTVDSSQVYDVEEGKWYDINAVYYSSELTDQDKINPDGLGHYYLQYLKAENETVPDSFITRWQYITPGYSKQLYAEDWEVYRYGYPKKDTAYIILFDSEQPTELAGYWDSNPTIRYVGVGPQTIDGVAKKWKVEADGEQYWMYANNTLHSFTLTDAYILNEAGTYFELQTAPTIRPFECYVQATESLKTRCAAIPMRGFRIDNTPTGAESIQGSAIRAEKILRNGQLFIIRNGVAYDATGVVIR